MTDLAAIAGSFAEFKTVKTRSVCVLSIEVPIEQADAALRALGGVPQPGKERHVAVALLNPDKILSGPSPAPPLAVSPTPEQTQAPGQGDGRPGGRTQHPVVTRAAMLCRDARFHRWFLRQRGYLCSKSEDPDFVAEVMRDYLGIRSRKELSSNEDARRKFESLDLSFKMAHGMAAEMRQ